MLPKVDPLRTKDSLNRVILSIESLLVNLQQEDLILLLISLFSTNIIINLMKVMEKLINLSLVKLELVWVLIILTQKLLSKYFNIIPITLICLGTQERQVL